MNIYRWLVQPLYPIDDLEIIYMDMSEVQRTAVPVMDIHKLMGWLIPRVKKPKDGLEEGRLRAADSVGRFLQTRRCALEGRSRVESSGRDPTLAD